MDPIRNPYTPGAGDRPHELVGRSDQIEALRVAVQRLGLGRPAQSQLVSGLRGVGKTVLLNEFGQVAKSNGWIHEHVELTEYGNFKEIVGSIARRSMLRLSAARRATERVKRSLAVLNAFKVRWQLPDGGELAFDFDPAFGKADSGVLDADLADLFEELGQFAKDVGGGVLITLDEVQNINKADLGALIMALHRVTQVRLPLLVAAGGLPSLPGLAGDAKSYAERLFRFVEIGSLNDDDSKKVLVETAAIEDVEWDRNALDVVIQATKGYPYFLQEYGRQCWDIAIGDTQVTPEDVEVAAPVALAELDTGFFRVRIDRTPDAERTYLHAMASLGIGPYSSGHVAKLLGKTTTRLGPVRDALIKRGLCFSPRHGEIEFTVPMFDEFIRRTFGNFNR